MTLRNLQIRIRRPPSRPGDLELIEAKRPALTNGSFVARALWLALDPFQAHAVNGHPGVRPGHAGPSVPSSACGGWRVAAGSREYFVVNDPSEKWPSFLETRPLFLVLPWTGLIIREPVPEVIEWLIEPI